MLDLDLTSMFRGGGSAGEAPTLEILTVCTGNICRSPLAEQLLRAALAELDVTVASAGTHALVDKPMTREAAKLAASLGVPADDSRAHRARWLTELHLAGPDLVLAMTREHRAYAVGLAPARLRSTFTVREFERLATGIPDADIKVQADAAGPDAHARIRAALTLLRAHRDQVEAPSDPADDDVIDPYRRSWEMYELSAAQMTPGIAQVARVVRAALA
ncbi:MULTISPECIES: low molecular weight phosphatase family protein [unclassified Microbacterium]|uniref:arsenate reductase/protein-tyrosine-phosphatase family protein n=1 Tax=unclassified Microbacterium TaxID=2609290 RepID=UPI003746EBDC